MFGSKPPRSFRPLSTVLAILAVAGAVCVVGVRANRSRHPAPAPASQNQSQPASVSQASPEPAVPGTPVSAEEVLGKLGTWVAAHPNCHSVIETSILGGGMLGRMEVFAWTNGVDKETVKVKANIYLPQALQFEAQNENGKVQVYFPRSGQMIEPDLSSALLSMPSFAANRPGIEALLKVAKNTFAEASADLRVVTLVLSAESLKLPFMTGDIYLSFRTDINGQLLGMEEQAQGTRIISRMRYVTFDKALVIRSAPSLPTNLVATGKSLQQAMQEEARLVMNKPLVGTKI